MSSNEEKNEMLVMVLTDLAGIYRKLAENPAVPDYVRVKARESGGQFDLLSAGRGKGNIQLSHFQGEQLMVEMARFLPNLLVVDARPSNVG